MEKKQSLWMMERRSIWIPVFALIVIILNIVKLIGWKTNVARILDKFGEYGVSAGNFLKISFILILLAIIACIGILLFKEWGRKFYIGCSIATYINIYLYAYLISRAIGATFIATLFASKVQIIAVTILLGIILCIFTRPSVKEQFR